MSEHRYTIDEIADECQALLARGFPEEEEDLWLQAARIVRGRHRHAEYERMHQ